jgi:hypothetical protein
MKILFTMKFKVLSTMKFRGNYVRGMFATVPYLLVPSSVPQTLRFVTLIVLFLCGCETWYLTVREEHLGTWEQSAGEKIWF